MRTRALRISSRHWWVLPVSIFLVGRAVDMTLLHLLAGFQGNDQPKGSQAVGLSAPVHSFGNLLANWDGQWYQLIAQTGYPSTLPREHGHVLKNAWAFYPMFPLLCRIPMMVGIPFTTSAVIVSILCGAIASCLLFTIVSKYGTRFSATISVLGLSFAAPALVLGVAYSESLALLLLLTAFVALANRRYGWVCVSTVLLGLARPVALPLALVMALHAWIRWRRRHEEPFPIAERVKVMVTGAVAVASFGLWPLVVAIVTGEHNAYFITQRAWTPETRSGWPSWLMMTVQLDSVGVVLGTIAVLLIALALTWPKSARPWGNEIRAWSFVYPLYIIGSTRPTTSIFRYLLLAIIPGWPAIQLSERVQSRQAKITIVTSVVLIGILLQWLWIRYFFIVADDRGGNP